MANATAASGGSTTAVVVDGGASTSQPQPQQQGQQGQEQPSQQAQQASCSDPPADGALNRPYTSALLLCRGLRRSAYLRELQCRSLCAELGIAPLCREAGAEAGPQEKEEGEEGAAPAELFVRHVLRWSAYNSQCSL